jgi:hypothetical protein
MKIGDQVRVVKCEVCPGVINKVGRVTKITDDNNVSINFGKGRPQKGRPELFKVDDITLADEAS